MADPKSTTHQALARIRSQWPNMFAGRFPDELTAAVVEWEEAFRHADAEGWRFPRRPPEASHSLMFLWPSLWRQGGDGQRAVLRARTAAPFKAPVAQAAIERFSRARFVLVEVVSVDDVRGGVVLRDLSDGRLLVVELPSPRNIGPWKRWMRGVTILVELAPGRWAQPSIAMLAPVFDDVDWPAFLARIGRRFKREGVAMRDDADPREELLRLGHLAWAEATSWATSYTPPRPRPKYLVTSDGDRFEHHESSIVASAGVLVALRSSLGSAPDFVDDGDGEFTWVGAPNGAEALGGIRFSGKARSRVSSSSKARFQRLTARLEAVAGTTLKVGTPTINRPWLTSAGLAAADGPEVDRIEIKQLRLASTSAAPTLAGVEQQTLRQLLRDQLDVHVPMLGGVPRALATTADGRPKVESWIRQQERHGAPGPDGGYVDLDWLRRELGLPTIEEEIRAAQLSWPVADVP